MAVTHVNVVADRDELIVTWRGGSPSLSVFVSHDPDDPGTDVRAPDAAGRSVIARSGSRHYIHLFEPDSGFTVTAQRCLDMDGPDNFRDLGGYPTQDGSTTRWGRVFRSDRLDELSTDDQAVIKSLGISTVFDLRSNAEVAAAPDLLPDAVDWVHLPMSSDVAQHRSLLARIIDGALGRGMRVVLAGMEAPPNFGPAYTSNFRDVFRRLAESRDVTFVPFLLEGVAGVASLNQADGIHPNEAGAARVAEHLWPSLEPLLRMIAAEQEVVP